MIIGNPDGGYEILVVFTKLNFNQIGSIDQKYSIRDIKQAIIYPMK
jgi:hypothetical protein